MSWEKDTADGRAYVKREREIFLRDLAQHEKGTVEEHREAQAKWVKDLTSDPELIAERVGWLLAGHYGKGAHDAAWECVDRNLVKPTYELLLIIATLEWTVPKALALASEAQVPEASLAAVYAAVGRAIKAEAEERV